MAGWTKEHKVAILVAVIGVVGVIAAALITSLSASDTNRIDQKTGRDGTVCVNSKC
ncbi:hypothetical protein KUM39_23755 [Streptomyces sp. J2-1]|uniref:hypothetical protein n=1 Tax=Streptomyces corallincola TaxID=2851888 RepID=UPI001C38472D|nr:hypothetical protein [Streptomyces corallincola]MBV2357350.1 hypothetical protein [Streptomyces corallincola]